jgi:hypothetical protein
MFSGSVRTLTGHYLLPELYCEMESFFGEAYLAYKKNTPEFFPFPFRKWFGKPTG